MSRKTTKQHRAPKRTDAERRSKRLRRVRVDSNTLRDGVDVGDGLVVRCATPDEVHDLDRWDRLVHGEDGSGLAVVLSMYSSSLGTALLAGLDGGHAARGDVVARGVATGAIGVPDFYFSTLVVLVASRDDVIEGVLVAGPSTALVPIARGAFSQSDDTLTLAHFSAVLYTSKVKLVAVGEEHRGQGVGSALLAVAVELYRRNQYQVMYGQFDTATELEAFYTAAGFGVLDEGDNLSLGAIFGACVDLAPERGERWFRRILS